MPHVVVGAPRAPSFRIFVVASGVAKKYFCVCGQLLNSGKTFAANILKHYDCGLDALLCIKSL